MKATRVDTSIRRFLQNTLAFIHVNFAYQF